MREEYPELISGKDLFQAFGNIAKSMEKLDIAIRRARLPRWKRRVINVCEQIIEQLEKYER